MPFSLTNVLDKKKKNFFEEAAKIINFTDSQPLSTHLLNILGDRMETLIKHFCIPKDNGCVSRKSTCGIVGIAAELATILISLDRMTDGW